MTREAERPTTSGSKRKRTLEWTMTVAEPEVDSHANANANADADADTEGQAEVEEETGMLSPKRSRQSNWSTDEPPALKPNERSVRRKHARIGLSSLNKRHAQRQDALRASKFQEGSMSDKPSAQPPSVFTRDGSNNTLSALANVDHLMSQYHDEEMSRPAAVEEPKHELDPEPVEQADDDTQRPSSLFRFGRMLTSSFHPASVWGTFSRTWKESKEELTVRNIEENRRRAQQKADVEAKYQELKKSGQFAFTVVGNNTLRSGAVHNTIASPVRSPVARSAVSPVAHHTIASPRQDRRAHADDDDGARKYATTVHSRHASNDSGRTLVPPPHLAALFSPTETPQPEPQPSEKQLKPRRSFFSLRAPSLSSLKRGRSEHNLANAFARNSNASLSPEKPPHSTLLHSHSKKDLNKQQKLSKRVSDLEAKLSDARHELNRAINNTSPLPPLPSRFEKFTPTPKQSSTFRSRFIGRLPSLPSERLLSPEQRVQDTPSLVRPRPIHSQSFDLTDINRGSSAIVDTPRSELNGFDLPPSSDYAAAPMDPATLASSDPLDQIEDGLDDQPSLASRLNALEASAKFRTKKSASSKKRKSGDDDDLAYKPTRAELNEDDDWDIVKDKPRRKRRSTGKKALNVAGKKTTNQQSAEDDLEEAATQPPAPAPIEASQSEALRMSLDSQDPSLGTINEEENIAVTSRVTKHDSGMSATGSEHVHAHFVEKSVFVKDTANRPRSKGPTKFRQFSPPPSVAYSMPNAVIDEQITVVPGTGSVPEMPSGSTGTEQASVGAEKERRDTAASKDHWIWDEEIF